MIATTSSNGLRPLAPRWLYHWQPGQRVHDPSNVLPLLSGIEDAIALAATAGLAFVPSNRFAVAFASAATAALAINGGLLFTNTWTAAATAALVASQGSSYSEDTTMAATAALALSALQNFLGQATMAATAALALAGTPNFGGTLALDADAAFAIDAVALLVDAVALAASAALQITQAGIDDEFSMSSLARLQLYGYVGLIPVDLVIQHAAIASPGLRVAATATPYLSDVQLSSPTLLRAQIEET